MTICLYDQLLIILLSFLFPLTDMCMRHLLLVTREYHMSCGISEMSRVDIFVIYNVLVEPFTLFRCPNDICSSLKVQICVIAIVLVHFKFTSKYYA